MRTVDLTDTTVVFFGVSHLHAVMIAELPNPDLSGIELYV